MAKMRKGRTAVRLENTRYPKQSFLNDLAERSNIDISWYDTSEVMKGFTAEENEHDGGVGKDVDTVESKSDILKIVVAHLREDPKYYSKIEKAGL